jgi:hypothetical protein
MFVPLTVTGLQLPQGAGAGATYFLKMLRLVWLNPGSDARVANPAAVGVSGAVGVTLWPIALRSKLKKKNSLFLMIGPPIWPP